MKYSSVNFVSYDDKKDFLDAYYRYAVYVKKLEVALSQYSKEDFANLQCKQEYGAFLNELTHYPWILDYATKEESSEFDNLLNGKTDTISKCHIGMRYLYAGNDGEDRDFIALPYNLDVHSDVLQVPSLLERYSIVYNGNDLLKDSSFVVDGRYLLKYNSDTDNGTLKDALNSNFNQKLTSFLYLTAVIDKYQDKMTSDQLVVESFASRFLAPMETVILNAMGYTAEVAQNIFKKHFPKNDYFKQAERASWIKSASNFRDYINIRHFLHHQNDSLYGYGNFAAKGESYKSTRSAWLQSYYKLCDNDLSGRLGAYGCVLDDFRGLAQNFCPNFLSRGKDESEMQFLSRVGGYCLNNPNQEVVLELNCSSHENALKMYQTIKGFSERIKIIDNPDEKLEDFVDDISDFSKMNVFLQSYQELDSYIRYYCLTHGENLVSRPALDFIAQKNVLCKMLVDRVDGYRALRNKVSHSYFSKDLAATLKKNQQDFKDTFDAVLTIIHENLPKTTKLANGLIRFTHHDGKIVDVDFNSKKIVQIKHPNDEKHKKVEEKNDTKVVKRDISTLADGTKIDYTTKRIVFADEAVFYFNSDDNYCLTIKNETTGRNVSILMNKGFKVKKYIMNNKEAHPSRGDVLAIQPYMITIDSWGRLNNYTYKDANGNKKIVKFNDYGVENIRLPNGDAINLKNDKPFVVTKQVKNILNKNKKLR